MASLEVPPFTLNEELFAASDLLLIAQKLAFGSDAEYQAEFDTPVLDELYPSLRYVARKSGSHIDPLHKQIFKCRRVVITEDPGLHLTWYYDTVYIKPLPAWLLNHAFWTDKLLNGAQAVPGSKVPDLYLWETLPKRCLCALGFVRSYSYLIRHSSDFAIARDAKLLPEHVTFQDLAPFLARFRSLEDSLVAPRYHFGQIRLTRLNWAIRLLRPRSIGSRWYYQERFWQTGQYLTRAVAPALFIFAAFSIVLSAMQVVIAARGETTWEAFSKASWGFSIAVIVAIPSAAGLLLAGALGLWVRQLLFAWTMARTGGEALRVALGP